MHMRVRQACPRDEFAIQALLERATYRLPHLWRWQDHLTDEPFVVIERRGIIVGVFFAWPDASPVAWVRTAALDASLTASDWIDLALPPTSSGLRQRGVQTLAWMDYDGWASALLPLRGFRRFEVVATMDCTQRAVTEPENAADVRLRPASVVDVLAIMRLDRAAFSPHWWYSASTLRRQFAASSHFVVAEKAGSLLGYVAGETHLPRSHLNRIAVHPGYQGRGMGALLLHDALCAFWRQGSERVTLNTQIDNRRALRLYRRFGFESTGDTVTCWTLSL